MRHIRLAALILFMLGLPAQAVAWDTPSYSQEDFCEEVASNPEILNEPMREVFGYSANWLERIWGKIVPRCLLLEVQVGAGLLTLSSAIESNISETDIKNCETRSLTPGGSGSYYKLADCLLRIEQPRQAVRDEEGVISGFPIYNFLALCQKKMHEAASFKQSAHDSCIEEESDALDFFYYRFGRLDLPPSLIGDCDKEISAVEGYRSYKKLQNCLLEAVRAERRRRRQELMKEER